MPISKLDILETSIYPKFTLVDNICFADHDGFAVLVKSKFESESDSMPRLNTRAPLKFPDIFEDDGALVATTADFFEDNGITVNRKGLSSAATAITLEGKTFNYSTTLTANITGIQATICVHPEVESPNKRGKKVDLNILGWYLILKLLGLNVEIASRDNNLLNSSKTFNLHYF